MTPTEEISRLKLEAEVHASNMRDLVAEHVRERDALSERVRELEQQLEEVINEMPRRED